MSDGTSSSSTGSDQKRRRTFAGIALVIVFVIVGLGGKFIVRADGGSDTTFSDTKNSVAKMKSISGKLSITGTQESFVDNEYKPVDVNRLFEFGELADGSLYSVNSDKSEATVYNANTHEYWNYAPSVSTPFDNVGAAIGGTPLSKAAIEGKHVVNTFATGPDAAMFIHSASTASLFGIIQNAAATKPEGTSVTSTALDGKPVWKVTSPLISLAISGSESNTTAYIDKKSHLPVQISLDEPPARFDIKFFDIEVNGQVADSRFTVEFPSGTSITEEDAKSRSVSITEAEKAAGYKPLVVGWTPSGFTQTELRYAATGSLETQDNDWARMSRNIVNTTYRQGFKSITINTREKGGDNERPWKDPGIAGDPDNLAQSVTSKAVTLESGRFTGTTATVVGRSQQQPHLWGIAGNVVFLVQGDATEEELIRIAESLR